jgi:hypothetical protein
MLGGADLENQLISGGKRDAWRRRDAKELILKVRRFHDG